MINIKRRTEKKRERTKEMKKQIISWLLAATMVVTMTPAAAFAETEASVDENGLAIDTTNFPDENFRRCVKEKCDWNWDGYLSESEIEDCTRLSVSSEGIESLEGISHFENLQRLNCGGNELTELPALPSGLTELECNTNSIVELPELPENLIVLDCGYNELKTLPDLPESLTELICYNNQLASLPELPDGLEIISCMDNELETLPELPTALTELSCDNNKIKSIPALPDGLTYISCTNNCIEAIPELPNTLLELHCDNNAIRDIPELPHSLIKLWCGGNQLTEIPDLPDTLIELGCGGNELTSLPELPEGLCELGFSENLLTELPELPEALTSLYAANNDLSGTVDVHTLDQLKTLALEENRITSVVLSPEAPYEYINVRNNYLEDTTSVTGRDDIPWGNVAWESDENKYYFAPQTPYCERAGNVHDYGEYKIVDKATFGENGFKKAYCKYCGAVRARVIKDVTVPELAKTSYVYDGKAKTPSVTVKNGNGIALNNGTDYTVVYGEGRKNVGTYKVKVMLKGAEYYGTTTVAFNIVPKDIKLSKLSKSKKSFTVKWKKPTSKYRKQMTGYQIRYSTASNMTKAKLVTVKGTKATSKKIKKLKAKKKYYVQIRTYKTVKGVKYYSSWSAKKTVKTR